MVAVTLACKAVLYSMAGALAPAGFLSLCYKVQETGSPPVPSHWTFVLSISQHIRALSSKDWVKEKESPK